MGRARIGTSAIVFDPIDPASAPNNSIYSDSTNSNAFSNKSSGGGEVAVTAATDAFVKTMKNVTGATIPLHKSVSKASDGSIVVADSDSAEGQQPIGVTLEEIANNAFGRIGLVGRNLPGALTGLSMVSGQEVYISEAAGFTADPNSFSGNNDSVILIGIADCADGVMSGVATDLVMNRQVMVRP